MRRGSKITIVDKTRGDSVRKSFLQDLSLSITLSLSVHVTYCLVLVLIQAPAATARAGPHSLTRSALSSKISQDGVDETVTQGNKFINLSLEELVSRFHHEYAYAFRP